MIAGIGELLWDIYQGEKFLGGATFNCVHHAQQLGYEGIIISRIGNDQSGIDLLNKMKQKGYNCDFVQIDKKNETGYVNIELDENAEPRFTCSEIAPYYFLEWDDRFEDLSNNLDVVIFGTFSQREKQAEEITERFLKINSKALKVFDVNFREWNNNVKKVTLNCLRYTDVLKINENELIKLQELIPISSSEPVSYLNGLISKYKLKLVCLTLGEWGSFLSDGQYNVYCPGVKIQPVDSTGAGDAFITTLTIKLNEGCDLKDAGSFANLVSSYVVTQKGATPEYDIGKIYDFAGSMEEFNIISEFKDYL
ncbi:carbohydrate kinase family protein [candidate division KSB1 bacterium]